MLSDVFMLLSFLCNLTLLCSSICHPLAPTYASSLATTPLACAVQAEARKNRKYDSMATSIGARFLPFVMETSGALGLAACNFPPDNSPLTLLWPAASLFTFITAAALAIAF